MPSGIDRTETELHVTPIQALGRTALLSGAFSLLPVFAVVTYLTHPTGSWPLVFGVEALVTLVFFTVYVRFRRVFIAVTRTHFIKRRMLLPAVAVERSRIDRVLLHRVYRSSSTEALTRVLGVDSLGRRVLGVNGLFWSEADIHRVIEALGVQATIDALPLSSADYYRAFPVARGWYLSRPFVVAVTVVVAILLVVVVLALQHVARTV